jgi:hypothetical protein
VRADGKSPRFGADKRLGTMDALQAAGRTDGARRVGSLPQATVIGRSQGGAAKWHERDPPPSATDRGHTGERHGAQPTGGDDHA